MRPVRKQESRPSSTWTFLTNHAHVLICLLLDPETRIRDVAAEVGITERASVRIVKDLEEAGFLVRHREGRRNHYELHPDGNLRHPMEANCTVGELLAPVIKTRRVNRKIRGGKRG